MAQIVTDTCRMAVWLCGRGLAAPLTVVSEQSFVSVKLLSCCEPGSVLQQLNVKKESPYITPLRAFLPSAPCGWVWVSGESAWSQAG